MQKNFNKILININSSHKNNFILKNFYINGLFKIYGKTLIDRNIDKFKFYNLEVFVLVDEKYFDVVNDNLKNKNIKLLKKEDDNSKFLNLSDDEKILIVKDDLYFDDELIKNLLFSNNLKNEVIIKIQNYKSVNNILLVSKNNLKFINFKNNSFLRDMLLQKGVLELEVQNESISFINSFDELIKFDYQYLNDNNFVSFTPGPVFIRPEIKSIVGNFINHHRTLASPFLYKDMAKNILWAFNSKKGFPIAINSPGTAALESCMVNLLEPGDKVLFLSNGYFGRNLINVSKRYNLDATYIDLPDGHEFDLVEIENLVKDKKALFFVHMDTSCGILNPIKEIANICNKYNVLVVVDSISTILNEEFNFDDWNITAAVCTSTKGFEVSPGLAFICVSEKGMEISKNIKTSKTSFLDWQVFANKHISNGLMPYTTPVSIVAAVSASSEYIKKIGGIEKLIANKKEMSKYLIDELKKLGFSMVIENSNNRSTWVNAVRTPFGIKASEIRSYLYVINNTLVETGILDESDSILRLAICMEHTWENVKKLVNDISKFLVMKNKVNYD